MEALIGFFLLMALWLSILEMRLRRAENKNRINKVLNKMTREEFDELKQQYGKEKTNKEG